MCDLKKILLDLAKSITYSDMYDLTHVPKILKDASNKIGELELEVIRLMARLEESRMNHGASSEIYAAAPGGIVCMYRSAPERPRIKQELDELGVEYSTKDNTARLKRKLERALREID